MRKFAPLLLLVTFAMACILTFQPKPISPEQTTIPNEATSSATPLQPVITASLTPQDTPQPTKIVTPVRPLVTVTQEAAPQATASATPTATATAAPKYSLQPGSPTYSPNFLETEAACNWSGIGGQVFSPNASPVKGLVVEVGGTVDGSPFLALTLTGNSPKLGPGGYEVKLADHLLDSSGNIYIQVFDTNGVAQTEKVFITTIANCDKNLVIMNFTGKYTNFDYLPFIGRKK